MNPILKTQLPSMNRKLLLLPVCFLFLSAAGSKGRFQRCAPSARNHLATGCDALRDRPKHCHRRRTNSGRATQRAHSCNNIYWSASAGSSPSSATRRDATASPCAPLPPTRRPLAKAIGSRWTRSRFASKATTMPVRSTAFRRCARHCPIFPRGKREDTRHRSRYPRERCTALRLSRHGTRCGAPFRRARQRETLHRPARPAQHQPLSLASHRRSGHGALKLSTTLASLRWGVSALKP